MSLVKESAVSVRIALHKCGDEHGSADDEIKKAFANPLNANFSDTVAS